VKGKKRPEVPTYTSRASKKRQCRGILYLLRRAAIWAGEGGQGQKNGTTDLDGIFVPVVGEGFTRHGSTMMTRKSRQNSGCGKKRAKD